MKNVIHGFSPDSADLEFLPYEDPSLIETVPWSDTLVFVLIISLCYASWNQWRTLQDEKEDLEEVYQRCHTMEISSKVHTFHTGIEKTFTELEKRNRAINTRFKRANALVKDDSFYSDFRYDLDEAQKCWTSNFTSFSLIDLNCDKEITGKWTPDMEFVDMETQFDSAISELYGTVSKMLAIAEGKDNRD